VTFRAGYSYIDGRQTDASGIARFNKQHTLGGGPEFVKALSAQRRLSVSLAAGATYQQKADRLTAKLLEGWMPTATASARIDLGVRWSLNGGYARGFSMLQGLTGEFYSTDRIGASIGARLNSRTTLALGGTVTNGKVALARSAAEGYLLYGATANFQLRLTSGIAATASYAYYNQHYSKQTLLPAGFPGQSERNALLVGFTFWAPLAGRLPAQPRAPGEW
jgi:hypothetical protein